MAEKDWRSNCSTPRSRMAYALENGIFSNVSFVVGSKEEVIKGHRDILILGSPIFQALLTGKSFENTIQIRDVQPNGFKPLLKYLYTDEIPEIPEEDYIEFLRAVKYFKVEELIEIARKNILEKLKLENAIKFYEDSKLLEDKELEEAAESFIKMNAESILAQPKFMKLSAKDLLHFISSDDFSAPEVPICLAIHKWGEAECGRQNLEKSPENIRLILKNIIPQIRFPLMNSSDFAVEIAKLNILTLEETVAVHNYFFARHHQRHQIPEGGRFISKPRKYAYYEIEDKVENVSSLIRVGGINTGLRTDNTIYTISSKKAGTNYLNMCYNYGGVAINNLAVYQFGGKYYLSTFWVIRQGSEPNTYALFSKYRNGYLAWRNDNHSIVIGPEDKKLTEFENLTFEPSKKAPGYFLLISGMKKPNSDKPLVLAQSEIPLGDGFYAMYIEKPEEEVDSILWKIQKIKL